MSESYLSLEDNAGPQSLVLTCVERHSFKVLAGGTGLPADGASLLSDNSSVNLARWSS